jgi:uncharacterized membrane protein YgdD (TMEM256/DUF423 family)
MTKNIAPEKTVWYNIKKYATFVAIPLIAIGIPFFVLYKLSGNIIFSTLISAVLLIGILIFVGQWANTRITANKKGGDK